MSTPQIKILEFKFSKIPAYAIADACAQLIHNNDD